jgi:PAS domain S-box-containing protein
LSSQKAQPSANRASAAKRPARSKRHARRTPKAAIINRSAHSEELLGRLIESVRDYAIFLLDPTGHVTTWNPGAQRIKGYRADEIIGKHFSVFYPQAAVLAGHCDAELAQAALEGRFEEEGWRVRKDGTRFWANVVISAVRNERGELLGFSKVTRDLTERKRAEEERAARLAADQANKAKDEFLAMLGHELRNPLAPIVTALQLVKLRTGRLSKEEQIIERQVNHMMRLVDDLLDIAQITQGKVVLRKQPLDVRELVAKAVEVASPLFEQRRHHFDVDAPGSPIPVEGDEARLTQVFANLLLNAAKYTEPGGHIRAQIELVDGDVRVSVHDDGKGIEPELLPRVFELFVQGQQRSDRASGGLGIGLALVRSLTALHGGRVSAHSDGVGCGSTFTVRLPVAHGDDAELDAHAARTGLRPCANARRVLLVDDNEDALELLAAVLSGSGHDVQTATDPIAALDAAKRWVPDIAILDIGLPVMDGYALAAQLRADLGDAAPRLIALTGYGQRNDRVRSEQAGFAAHLIKPIDAQRLLDVLGEMG